MLEQGSGELVLQLGELSQSLALVVLGIRMLVQFLAYWFSSLLTYLRQQ